MNCPNCGSPLKDGVKFCPVCGAEVYYAPINPVVERSVVETPKTENKGLKITLIVLIVLLVILIAGVVVYFTVPSFHSEEEAKDSVKCEECGEDFDGDGDLCDECKEKAEEEKNKKEKKKDPEPKVEKGECNLCEEEINAEDVLCEDCMEKIRSDYDSEYECGKCGDSIDLEDVAVIDDDGYVYCDSCDRGNYCDDCGAPIDKNDDDEVCCSCADIVCEDCGEVLEEDEVAGYSEDDKPYCEDCYVPAEPENQCNQCGDSHDNEGLLCNSCLAKIDEENYEDDYMCLSCSEFIDVNQIAVVDDDGFIYCEDCDLGKYCEECNAPLPENNESGYCEYCA